MLESFCVNIFKLNILLSPLFKKEMNFFSLILKLKNQFFGVFKLNVST